MASESGWWRWILGALAAVYVLNFSYLKLAEFSWYTLYTINHAMVGLVLAGVAFATTGPSAIVAFGLNGAIAMLTALSFSEMASKFPESGGVYTFSKKVLSVAVYNHYKRLNDRLDERSKDDIELAKSYLAEAGMAA